MHLTLCPYRLALTAPLVMKGTRYAAREGVLVRLDDAEGRTGWGDAAPLPGFSPETLDEATAALDRLDVDALGTPEAAWSRLDHPIHDRLDALALPPSARFGLEAALLDLVAQAAETTLPCLLHPDPEVTVPVNALVVGDAEADIVAEAGRLVAAGYRTLKVKLGRRPVDEEAATLRALRRALGPGVALRGDANQAWSFDEAVAFAEGVAGLGLEYVEEPLAEPADLPRLWFDTGLPVALDESLVGMNPSQWPGKGFASAAVLKPTLLGGIVPTLRMAAGARSVGVVPVLSGAFESGIAMRAHVALAAATGGAAAGLAPYGRLAEDVLKDRLALGPTVDVPGLFRHAPVVR